MDSSTFLSLHNFMKTFVSLFLKKFITNKSRYRKIFKRLSRCLHVSIPSDISINFFGRRDLLQQFENKVFFLPKQQFVDMLTRDLSNSFAKC